MPIHTLEQLRSGALAGAKRIKIAAGLTAFPPEILDLAETLEILDLSGNRLTRLPDDFARLRHLRIAFFSDNDFTEFPTVLAACPALEMVGFKANRLAHIPAAALSPQLRWLILTDNRLTDLPATIGRCHRLQKLMLAGNALRQLPAEMAACQSLELLRISANHLQELPAWLLTLPRLSWLAFGGNPGTGAAPGPGSHLVQIPWDSLQLAEQLGEGASGVIARADWQHREPGRRPQSVAVKVFKGAVTSDGLPADEMNACIAAGGHPNLVPVLGQISHHPEQRQGLVLALIPPAFRNLGGPPSFQTCTRDTYPAGTLFAFREVMRIATGIAAAARHLHDRGFMHGDLYAHNILVDDAASPILGDFGAATPYDRAGAQAPALERLEVRAFGCLLDDLLQHLAPQDSGQPGVTTLAALRQACMGEAVLQRPDFAAICQRLADVGEEE
jgi:Protein tyrosine and serine/threonine kinase/Leucine rich repeat/Leucine Rich Repeat